MNEMVETDLDYIKGMVGRVTNFDGGLPAINKIGLDQLMWISKDLAIGNGPDHVIDLLEEIRNAFIEFRDKYTEYHEIYNDYEEIEAL